MYRFESNPQVSFTSESNLNAEKGIIISTVQPFSSIFVSEYHIELYSKSKPSSSYMAASNCTPEQFTAKTYPV